MTSFVYDRSNGQLSLWEQFQRTLHALSAPLTAPRRRKPGAHTSARPLSVDDALALTPPQDSLSRHAWQLAQNTQAPWLLQHALRTYVWGELLGIQGNLAPQRPLLFAACMLHDVGLTAHAATPQAHCFAVRGARYAQQQLGAYATPAQARQVANAISLHLDLAVGLEHGPEAHLLQAGAAMDVMGKGVRRIPAPVQAVVLQSHPRLDMKQQLCSCLQASATEAPRTRMGLYARRLGFLDLVRKAPFPDSAPG